MVVGYLMLHIKALSYFMKGEMYLWEEKKKDKTDSWGKITPNNKYFQCFHPTEISNQCSPLPCHKDGYKDCIDGQAKYTCVCKPGWQGEKCEEGIISNLIMMLVLRDTIIVLLLLNSIRSLSIPTQLVNECLPPSRDFYFVFLLDINECEDLNGGCSQRCSNLPGSYRCLCEDGYFMHSNKRDCGGMKWDLRRTLLHDSRLPADWRGKILVQ